MSRRVVRDEEGSGPSSDLPEIGETIEVSPDSAYRRGRYGDTLLFLDKNSGRPWRTFRAAAGPVIFVSGLDPDEMADGTITLEVTGITRKGDPTKGRATIHAQRRRPSLVAYE